MWGHRVPEFSKCLEILSLCLFFDESWKAGQELGTAGSTASFTGMGRKAKKGLLSSGVPGVPVIYL